MDIYNLHDVVLVPFPFVDGPNSKRRPALVISSAKNFNKKSSTYIMAMITSACHSRWPLDVEVIDLVNAGLPVKSIIRMKLFTIDHRLIIKKLGHLEKQDGRVFSEKLRHLFAFA